VGEAVSIESDIREVEVGEIVASGFESGISHGHTPRSRAGSGAQVLAN
jgi:hypothetical protein